MTQDPNTWADAAIAELDAMQGPLPGTPAADAQARANIGSVLAQRKAEEPAWIDSAMAEMDEYAKDPNLAETALRGGGRGLLGAAKNVIVDLPRTIGTAVTGIEEYNSPANKWLESALTPGEVLQPKTLREADSPVAKYSEMAGYVAPSIASMLAGNWTGATRLGTTLGVTGTRTAAAFGAAQQAGASGEMARQAGAGRGGIALAGAGGALIGGAGSAAIEGVLTKLNTQAGNAIIRAIERDAVTLSPTARMAISNATTTGIRAAEGTVAGAGMGLAYTALTNAIHNYATDDDISLLLGAIENAVFGAVLGGMIRGATQAALERRRFTGRKFTANGWEGPELDMSGVLDQPSQDYAPPLTRTPEEILADPRLDPEASRAMSERIGAEAAAEQALNPPPIEYTTVGKEGPRLPQGKAVPEYDPSSYVREEQRLAEFGPGMYPPDEGYTVKGRPSPNTPKGERTPEFVPDTSYLGTEDPNVATRGIRPPDEGYTTTRPTLVEGKGGKLVERPYSPTRTQPTGEGSDLVAGDPSHPDFLKRGFAPQAAYESQSAAARYQSNEAPTLVFGVEPTKPSERAPVVDRGGRTIVNLEVDRLRGTREDTANVPRVMTRQEVIAGLEQAAQILEPGLAIRTGMGSTDAAGLQSSATKTIRLARYGEFGTAAHEVGHAIENSIFGTTDSPFFGNEERYNAVSAELTKLGKMANPGNEVPRNGYISEGWGEFVRLWVAQHEDLMRAAPETTRWFDGEYLRKNQQFGDALEKARGSADVWRFQGDVKREFSMITPAETRVDRVLRNLDPIQRARSIMQNWIMKSHVLSRYENAKAALGSPTPYHRRLDVMLEATVGMAEDRVHRFIREESVGLHGNTTGESLTAAVAPMIGNDLSLDAYIAARRKLWLLTERMGMNEAGEPELNPHFKGTSEASLRYTIAELEAKFPQIEDTARRVLSWYERAWDYCVECVPELAYVRDSIRQEGEWYAPLHTAFEDGSGPRPSSSVKGAARRLEMAKKLKPGGSTRPTKPIVQQFQTEVAQMFRKAHERMMLDAMFRDGRDAGLGALFEDLTETFHGTGEGWTIGSEIPPEAIPEASLDAYFARPTLDANSRAVFQYVSIEPNESGQMVRRMRAAALQPEVYEAIAGVNPNELRTSLGFLGALGRRTRNAQVVGHVMLKPAWFLYKNLIWDPQTAYLTSRESWATRDMLIDWIPNMMRVVGHEFTNGKLPYEWTDAYKKLGSRSNSPMLSEIRAVQSAKNIMLPKSKKFAMAVTSPESWLEVLGKMMTVTDEARPIWEMKRVAKRVGWKPGQEMTHEQFMEMSLATRRVSGNRAMAGAMADHYNQSIAFFRAAISEPREVVRAATTPGNRLRFAIKAGFLAAMGAYYSYRMKDDEGVDSQLARERYQKITLNMPTGDDGSMFPVSIPIAPEIAPFWKMGEFAMDAWSHQNPLEAEQVMGAMFETYMPPWIPSFAQEPILQFANKKRFSGPSKIVPMGEEQKFAREQFNEYTAPLAVRLGHILNWSPRRLEHAITNIFGAPGEFVLNDFNLAPDKKNSENALRDMLEGNWLRRGGSVNAQSRWVDKLTELADYATMQARSSETEETPEQMLLRRQIMDTHRQILAGYAIAKTFAMTDKERQSIYLECNNAAKRVVEEVTSGKLNPGQAKAGRMQAEFRLKALKAGAK